MAAQKFIIRCQTENGSLTLQDLNSNSTIQDLKDDLARNLGCLPGTVRIMAGYPPRPLIAESDDMTLGDVNIHSGETIIVQRLPEVAPIISDDRVVREAAPHVLDAGGAGDHTDEYDKMLEENSGIMMRQVVPSNNSCLFTSVYYCLSNGHMNTEKSTELRRIISKVVSDNPEKYNQAFLGMSNRDYCRWILNNDHWGGAIELSILSEHFGIEIVAVDTLTLAFHRFGEDYEYVNRIFLIYDGIHYDPLVLELQNGGMQTIFSISDEYPMEMALEVGREARSSRQYTDVANFTLRCNQCEVRLRGDAEAREHALATGHVQFGEITD